MSILKIIYLLGQCLVAASENTWIQAYVSDTQKKRFFFIFCKIINMSNKGHYQTFLSKLLDSYRSD